MTTTSDLCSVSKDLVAEFDQAEDQICSICCNGISSSKNTCTTECGHQFCFGCIMRMVSSCAATSDRCPLCRAKIFEPAADLVAVADADADADLAVDLAVDLDADSFESVVPQASVDQITHRLKFHGITMSDLVALLTGRCDNIYTEEHIEDINAILLGAVECEDGREIRREQKHERDENEQMGNEDTIKIRIDANTIYDPITGVYTDNDGCIC